MALDLVRADIDVRASMKLSFGKMTVFWFSITMCFEVSMCGLRQLPAFSFTLFWCVLIDPCKMIASF